MLHAGACASPKWESPRADARALLPRRDPLVHCTKRGPRLDEPTYAKRLRFTKNDFFFNLPPRTDMVEADRRPASFISKAALGGLTALSLLLKVDHLLPFRLEVAARVCPCHALC